MQALFVSSTFKDMQGERDTLHRLVIPRLREKARSYGENIQFVDLRWGISTTDMDSDEGAEKILEVCLEEIRQCKPYMIVLLGERYGWMPSPALLQGSAEEKNFSLESYEMSVTELEIQYGMYLAQGQIDRCVFCLREELPVETLPAELRDIYVADSDADRQRMRRLREKICSTPGVKVIHYQLNYDREKKDFTGYEAFADRLTETLEGVLSGGWQQRKGLSWQERQREEDALVIERHQASFAGRYGEILSITSDIRFFQVVILEGEGGCGKSALMSVLLQEQQARGKAAEMFCCGNSSYCMSTLQLMKLMWWQMNRLCGQNMLEEVTEVPDFLERFNHRMAEYAGPEVVFFIDAIDQLSPDRGLYESWFMPPVISEKIKFVISTTGAVRVNPMALSAGEKGMAAKTIHLVPPKEEDLREILDARFLAEHKQVSKKVADKILENPCSKNMLGMEVMIRRLTMLGKEDFQKIAELEKIMDGNQAIDVYLIQIIEQMSEDLYGLINQYMKAVSTFLDKDRFACVQLQIYSIAQMQNGLSKDQMERLAVFITEMFSSVDGSEDFIWRRFWDPILFARIKQYLGSLLIQQIDGRINFSHRLLREALMMDDIAAPVRPWLLYEPQADVTRLENILILTRMFEESEKKLGREIDDRAELIRIYVHETIKQAGRLENDPDPDKAAEGKRQMEILQRSILNDLGDKCGWNHLDVYCDMLECIIKDGAGPRYYMVWFFGIRLCDLLEKQGEREKAMALQILCRIITSLNNQKQELVAGKTEYSANWTLPNKHRMLLYYTRAMRIRAELWQSAHLGIVEIGWDYGLDTETNFKMGIALAEECLAEAPMDAIYHLRKACLYSDYADLMKGTDNGNVRNKLIENAMESIKNTLKYMEDQEEKKISLYGCCVYVISCCVKTMTKNLGIYGRKTMLKTIEEYLQMGWDLVEDCGNKEKMAIEYVAQLLLAWSEYCQKGTSWYNTKAYKSNIQRIIDKLFNYYYSIREKDTLLTPNAREMMAVMGAKICTLALYGYVPACIKEKGCGTKDVIQYIIKKEGSYLQAQARSDIASRWRWAQMLCAETFYYYGESWVKYFKSSRQTKILLQELAEDVKKGYSIEVTQKMVEEYQRYIQRLDKGAVIQSRKDAGFR